MLLAKVWTNQDPTGWWMSEKLDGIRAIWTGCEFLSRGGRVLCAPAFFTANLPAMRLDGELWAGRGLFERSAGIALTKSKRYTDLWRDLQFLAFDAPQVPGAFEERMAAL